MQFKLAMPHLQTSLLSLTLPVPPSLYSGPILFPGVVYILLLCNYCSCTGRFCFPPFLVPLFLPPTTLLIVYLMPLCPCPKAPWVGGGEQKQRAGLLAWRSGSWPYIPKKVEGPLSFTTVRRALCCWRMVRVWCWNAAQDKSFADLPFSMTGLSIFLPDKSLFLKPCLAFYHCTRVTLWCKVNSIWGGQR